MNCFALFTDVSLNPSLKLGVGCYLLVPASFLEVSPQNIERSDAAQRLMQRRFTATSSSKLEVQTVLWALEDCRNKWIASDIPSGLAGGGLQLKASGSPETAAIH